MRSDRSAEVVLLGAGASAEAEVPTAHRMTDRILDQIEASGRRGRERDALVFVIGGLAFERGIQGDNPMVGLDVEVVFETVRSLARRTELQISPFLGSWHSRIEELERVQPDPFVDHDMERWIENLMSADPYRSRGFQGRDLAQLIRRITGTGAQRDVFASLAERMITALRSLVWIRSPRRVSYLAPMLRLLEHQEALTVATLNYDNGVELAASDRDVPVDVGVDRWRRPGHIRFSEKGVRLLKLHGSIDWKLGSEIRNGLAVVKLDRVDPEQRESYTPAIIFGQSGKLQAEGPYVDLLRRFSLDLSRASVLTTIGYSFRDEHINYYLGDWLSRRPSNRLRIVNRSDPLARPTRGSFLAQLARARIEDKSRVEVVEMVASKAIAELWA